MVVAISALLPSPLKIWVYKTLLRARIGAAVKIKFGSLIMSKEIEIEDGVIIGSDVHIMNGKIHIGEESIICSEVRTDGEGSLTIGRNCYVGQRTLINATESVHIDDGVGIGSDCSIFTHGVWVSYLEGLPRKFAPVTIRKNSWIPPRCLILPGVTIGEGAILTTGAVVTKDIPDRAFAGGIPATVIRSVEELRDSVSPQEKDRRVREILEAFVTGMGRPSEFSTRQKAFSSGLLFETLDKTDGQTYSIYYDPGRVSAETLRLLASQRSRFDALAIVALQGFTSEARGLLEKEFPFEWFDLDSYVRKRSWIPLSLLLRDFFRGRYGVRFLLAHN